MKGDIMKDFLTRLAGWFTDSRRQAAQALITSTLTLLVVLGAVSEDQSTALVNLAASVLLLVQGAIGLLLLRPSEWYVWLNGTGRAAVYAVATALGPIGIVFELWGSEQSARIAAVATVLVSILTAFVQVLNAHTLAPAAAPIVPVHDEVAANQPEGGEPTWNPPLS